MSDDHTILVWQQVYAATFGALVANAHSAQLERRYEYADFKDSDYAEVHKLSVHAADAALRLARANEGQ